MTSTEELLSEDGTYQERGQLEGTLRELWQARQAKNAAEADNDRLSAPIRKWLAAHPGEELRDGESGVVAFATARRTRVYDLRRLTDEQVIALRDAGCLDLKPTLFMKLQEAAPNLVFDDIWHAFKRGAMHEEESQVLQVRRDR